MQDKEYLIYCHTSPSGKKYIGQTNNYNRRCTQHKNPNRKKLFAFHNAINKYGWDSFKHEILKDNLTTDEANNLEEYFIKEYNTLAPNGYNLQTGGKNSKPSIETRLKISNNCKQKGLPKELNHRYGSKHSEETKQKMRDSFINRFQNGSKLFIVTTPTGEVIELFGGLNKYCKDNNLDNSTMLRVANGLYKMHKGYKCSRGEIWV
jgi:group I intron endonuclease